MGVLGGRRGEGPVWRRRICVGHVWGIPDPDVRTLACTERVHRGRRRRTRLLLEHLHLAPAGCHNLRINSEEFREPVGTISKSEIFATRGNIC